MNDDRVFATALSMASAMCLVAGPATAARFDGSWTMVAETTRGHCGVINVAFAVTRGRIRSAGSSFAFHPIRLQGRVSATGRARIAAIAGPQTAGGTGRFNGFRGSGTWSGTGPSGLCSGVWTANRY